MKIYLINPEHYDTTEHNQVTRDATNYSHLIISHSNTERGIGNIEIYPVDEVLVLYLQPDGIYIRTNSEPDERVDILDYRFVDLLIGDGYTPTEIKGPEPEFKYTQEEWEELMTEPLNYGDATKVINCADDELEFTTNYTPLHITGKRLTDVIDALELEAEESNNGLDTDDFTDLLIRRLRPHWVL